MTGGTFISYRRDDAAGFAGRLSDSLERLLPGVPVFRDVDAIPPGHDFVRTIETRLRDCRLCLVVIGRTWLEARSPDGRRRLDEPGDFVRMEVAGALARPDVLVVPVLVDGATMPPAEQLPAEIRELSRRHALAVRDESWDEDVERVARVIRRELGNGGGTGGAVGIAGAGARAATRITAPARRWLPAGVAAAVVMLLAWWMIPRSSNAPVTPASSAQDAPAGPGGGRPAASGRDQADAELTAARPIAVPRVSQVASRDHVYTLLSAAVTPAAPSRRLVARVALENNGDYPANFWDDSFRLVAGADVLSPTSRLNTIVQGASTAQGTVTFDLPAGVTTALLRVRSQEAQGDIPLRFDEPVTPADDVSATARPERALVRTIVREPRGLFDTAALSATLSEVTARQFANVLRVICTLRVSTREGFTLFANTVPARLLVGDDTLVPIDFPSEHLPAGTSRTVAIVFDAAPDVTRAVLRVAVRDTPVSVDVPLTLR